MTSLLSFDPTFQKGLNGPLSDSAITRILAVQAASKLTLNQIGVQLGVSGSFLGNLVRGYEYKGRPTAIRTKHIERVKAALAAAEMTYNLRQAETKDGLVVKSETSIAPASGISLETHLKAVHDLGFAVTLTPLR